MPETETESRPLVRELLTTVGEAAQHQNLGAIDATYFERSPASRSYCNKTEYEVTKLKATKLIDTETNVILDLHCQ